MKQQQVTNVSQQGYHTQKYTGKEHLHVLDMQHLQCLIIEVEQDGAALDDALGKLVKIDLL